MRRLGAPVAMDLDKFLPYRLAVLSEQVSQCVALVYRERFGLSRDEWRVLAALADGRTVKTGTVIETTALDKMQVSRAVKGLQDRSCLERVPDPQDGRGWLLRLKPAGKSLFQKIAPMVQAREAFLLEALSDDEREVLDRAIEHLGERSLRLTRQG
jgi:DNA-binding MarR family transcriptional regulator